MYVEQAPRQYYAPDWKHAHATCYDEPSLAALQTQLACDTPAFDEPEKFHRTVTGFLTDSRNDDSNDTDVLV